MHAVSQNPGVSNGGSRRPEDLGTTLRKTVQEERKGPKRRGESRVKIDCF